MICPLSVITTKIFARELLWAVMQRKMFFYIFHQKQIQCWLLVSPHSFILLTDNIMLNLFKRVVLGKKKNIYIYISVYLTASISHKVSAFLNSNSNRPTATWIANFSLLICKNTHCPKTFLLLTQLLY